MSGAGASSAASPRKAADTKIGNSLSSSTQSSDPTKHEIPSLPMTQPEDAVARIAYEDAFVAAMDRFRGALSTGEISQRVLDLTTKVIKLNAANYTAWHHRRVCLLGLGSDLAHELESSDGPVASTSPKNYQLWYHRRALAEELGKSAKQEDRVAAGRREVFYTAMILGEDNKNYHAWSHRQWVVGHFDLWENAGEMEFAERMLEKDVRNNSAWNHRFFLITRGGARKGALSHELCAQEIGFALAQASLALHNESPYTYILGVSRQSKDLNQRSLASFPFVRDWYVTMVRDNPLASTSLALQTFHVELLADEGKLADAVEACLRLGREVDFVRADYWKWRASTFLEMSPKGSS